MNKPINFAKTFEKAYSKRVVKNEKLRKAYAVRYKLFAHGERDYPVYDHALTGKMAGKRAFSVAGDVRVVYIETDETIIFIDVGSHNQVYR